MHKVCTKAVELDYDEPKKGINVVDYLKRDADNDNDAELMAEFCITNENAEGEDLEEIHRRQEKDNIVGECNAFYDEFGRKIKRYELSKDGNVSESGGAKESDPSNDSDGGDSELDESSGSSVVELCEDAQQDPDKYHARVPQQRSARRRTGRTRPTS